MQFTGDLRRREFLKALGLTGIGLATISTLAGCGEDEAATGGPASQGGGEQPPSQKTDAAASHFQVLVHHAPIHAGLARGLFDEVIPEFTSFSGGSDTVRAVTTGTNDWGISSATGPVLASVAGEDMVMISSWFNETDVVIMVAPDSPVTSVAGLKGRKVAQSKPGSNTEYVIKKALDNEGIDGSEVTIVSLGGAAEQLTALRNGVVDAITVTEPNVSRYEAAGDAKPLLAAADVVSPWMELTVATMRPFLAENKDMLSAVQKSLQECVDFVKSSPDEVATLWAKAVKLDEPIAKAAVNRYANTTAWSTQFNEKALGNLSEASQFLKIVDAPIEWDEYIDQSVLPENMRISL